MNGLREAAHLGGAVASVTRNNAAVSENGGRHRMSASRPIILSTSFANSADARAYGDIINRIEGIYACAGLVAARAAM